MLCGKGDFADIIKVLSLNKQISLDPGGPYLYSYNSLKAVNFL